MTGDAEHHDATALLRAEHAAAGVLAEVCDEATAYPRLLAAIGAALGWEIGAVWLAVAGEGGETGLRCVETWPGPEPFEQVSRSIVLAPGEGLPGRVWASGEPAWVCDVAPSPNFPRARSAARAGLRTAFCFPIRGADGMLGAIEFFARELREPDAGLLATMASLGGRIGQSVQRWRSELALRESDARKSAILNAAFDCIITMDADGHIVEVNRATEETFGYAAREMVGRELAELIIPPALREAHRTGVERYVATGQGRMVGHPVELPAMRADGSEFPVEMAITRPDVEGAPLFTGYLRDVTARHRDEAALRALAEQQAALRRVATTVASEAEPERVFAAVTEEVGRLLGAQTANMVCYADDGTATVVGAWSTGEVRSVPLGTRIALDGPTVAARILRSGRPERLDNYDDLEGTTAELLRGLGFRAAVGGPISFSGRLWGAVMVSTVEDRPFPGGAEQRIADFAELVALALANAEAREALAASRARIVEAADAERWRIERNLHDGAQQQLIALSLMLRRAEALLAEGDPEAPAVVSAAGDVLADALAELRELARGIHPAVLTDRGLAPALEMLAGRSGVPCELAVALDERLPPPVEAAAYYLVAEALANASKHAQASRVRVQLQCADGAAVVEVSDDGVGGAVAGGGSGLRGLGDRVEALGGRLALSSPPGAGTTLSARIPC
jgi:PAS domain S-box-containing protein